MLLNDHISKILPNEFGGSEKKKTIIMDDGNKYLLKCPDPIRELKRTDKISYINNALSEYIGCKIAKSIGLPAQEVVLGIYKENEKEKLSCACKSLLDKEEKMYEIDKLLLEHIDEEAILTFDTLNNVFNILKNEYDIDAKEFYFNEIVLDSLIGNTDRHNGNWAIIINQENGHKRISPIYDCGSCLYPLAPDDELIDSQNKALGAYSAIRDNQGVRLNFHEMITKADNLDINNAIKRIIPKINLSKINEFIQNIEYISQQRKDFYVDYIKANYEKTLLKALSVIIKPMEETLNIEDNKLYDFYKNNIKKIKELPEFAQKKLYSGDTKVNIMRVSNKYAICFDDSGCLAIFSLRSNNDEVREAIRSLLQLGFDINKIINGNDVLCLKNYEDDLSKEVRKIMDQIDESQVDNILKDSIQEEGSKVDINEPNIINDNNETQNGNDEEDLEID